MRNEDFTELLNSAKEAVAISKKEKTPARIFQYTNTDIQSIRAKTKKSQAEFASMIGVKLSTLQNWEQGRRKPEGPAMVLLKLVDYDPEYVEKVLQM